MVIKRILYIFYLSGQLNWNETAIDSSLDLTFSKNSLFKIYILGDDYRKGGIRYARNNFTVEISCAIHLRPCRWSSWNAEEFSWNVSLLWLVASFWFVVVAHVAVVHHSQQGEERKNGEGSSQASGRGTSSSPSAIRWKMKIPLT